MYSKVYLKPGKLQVGYRRDRTGPNFPLYFSRQKEPARTSHFCHKASANQPIQDQRFGWECTPTTFGSIITSFLPSSQILGHPLCLIYCGSRWASGWLCECHPKTAHGCKTSHIGAQAAQPAISDSTMFYALWRTSPTKVLWLNKILLC